MWETTKAIGRGLKTFLGWAAAMSAIFLVTTIGWAWLDNEPPMSIRGPTRVINYDVPRGGILKLVRNVNRHRFCPGRVSRYHIDSIGVPHLAQSYDFPLPTPAEAKRQLEENIHELYVEVPIPVDMPQGESKYQGLVAYYCNFLQRLLDKPIVVTTEVIHYNVLPEETKDLKKPHRRSERTYDFPAIQGRPFEAP